MGGGGGGSLFEDVPLPPPFLAQDGDVDAMNIILTRITKLSKEGGEKNLFYLCV